MDVDDNDLNVITRPSPEDQAIYDRHAAHLRALGYVPVDRPRFSRCPQRWEHATGQSGMSLADDLLFDDGLMTAIFGPSSDV